MKFRYLGDSGLLVSRVCLGTMTFGMEGWGCDRATAVAITNKFIEAGGNFIDTADMYSQGVSEEMVGEAIQGHSRDDLVLATKCWFRMRPSPNAKGLSRKHILSAVDDSLRRLRTDYIDLYQMHGPDPFTPLEESMRAADDLVRSGKVRYLGCSNFFGWQMVKANAVADRLGFTRLISGQHMYNLLRRDIEREILGACADQGMGMLCWSPLAGCSPASTTKKLAPTNSRASVCEPRSTSPDIGTIIAFALSKKWQPWPTSATRPPHKWPSLGPWATVASRPSSSALGRLSNFPAASSPAIGTCPTNSTLG